ncbi:hypothetical protein Ccrd_001343, partial [Cynara cardunculus var. scolymus]
MENGELQKIHDHWLKRKTCSLRNSDSDQLQLESFCGLFLIFGVACALALGIHFCMVLREFGKHDPSPEKGSRSVRLQRFLSFADEKEEISKRKLKRKRDGREVNRSNRIQAEVDEDQNCVSDFDSINTSFDSLIKSRSSDSDQNDLIQIALHLGSVRLEAGKRSDRKRSSFHNAVVWPLPPDLTIKGYRYLGLGYRFVHRLEKRRFWRRRDGEDVPDGEEETAINEYFKPVDKQAEMIVEMQLKEEEKTMKQMMHTMK